MALLIRNARIVTMNDRLEVVDGSVAVEGNRIVAVGELDEATCAQTNQSAGSPRQIIDARGGLLLPGFIQTHIHLCQTLFRGYADDLPLMEWLRRRVWPMEAAHTAASLRASARLACAELLRTGTTTALTMGH
jgi:cytosine/adenosine deaminase-related metal-dependent hydrolase